MPVFDVNVGHNIVVEPGVRGVGGCEFVVVLKETCFSDVGSHLNKKGNCRM